MGFEHTPRFLHPALQKQHYGRTAHYNALPQLDDQMPQNSGSTFKVSYVIISSLDASSRYFLTMIVLAAVYRRVLMSSERCSFKKFHSETSVQRTLQLSNQQNQEMPQLELHLHASLCPPRQSTLRRASCILAQIWFWSDSPEFKKVICRRRIRFIRWCCFFCSLLFHRLPYKYWLVYRSR